MKENILNNVYVVGNTVIDALFSGIKQISYTDNSIFTEKYSSIDFSKKLF